MRFTVFHLMQAPDWLADADVYRNEIELMLLAEELGFDAVWVAEHHFFHYCIDPDPLILATHVAARTSRIRIGSAANILTLTHPLRVAEQAAMLDILSQGRLDVGFAKGYGPREFAGYGVDLRDADDRFHEALEIVMRAWTEPGFSFEGKHFQIPPSTLRPRPLTQPHPRAFIATTGNVKTLEAAARYCIPFYVGYRGRAHFAGLKNTYAELAKAAGHDGEAIDAALRDVAVMMTSYIAPTDQESFDEARSGVNWMSDSVDAVNVPEDLDRWPKEQREHILATFQKPDRGYRDYDGYWNAFAYGGPERGIERIQRLRDAGIEHVLLGFSFGGLPYDKVRRSMELFAREVMPRFK
ncbi:MAG: LLM class flavin-dependent oxidoreductase [Chloroflexi bacterium]|nr:LLM class flavin-dependent oxidoreductase [Chloroflexota bacterium]